MSVEGAVDVVSWALTNLGGQRETLHIAKGITRVY
jgi:hypothetical protein